MLLEQKDIEELKQIHFEESGEDLSDDEAADMARRLLLLYRLFATVPLSDDNNPDASTARKKNDSE